MRIIKIALAILIMTKNQSLCLMQQPNYAYLRGILEDEAVIAINNLEDLTSYRRYNRITPNSDVAATAAVHMNYKRDNSMQSYMNMMRNIEQNQMVTSNQRFQLNQMTSSNQNHRLSRKIPELLDKYTQKKQQQVITPQIQGMYLMPQRLNQPILIPIPQPIIIPINQPTTVHHHHHSYPYSMQDYTRSARFLSRFLNS